MKNITLAIFTAITFLITNISFAEDFNTDKLMSTGSHMTGKDYQEIAKFFGMDIFSSNSRFSSLRAYYKDEHSNVISQIFWFSDGCIATQMTGENKGKQTIFWNNEIFDSSSNLELHDGEDVTYKYSWGSVKLSDNGCSVGRNY